MTLKLRTYVLDNLKDLSCGKIIGNRITAKPLVPWVCVYVCILYM